MGYSKSGVSSIIAVILMLMITIGMAGSAYMFISGFFTKTTSTSFSIVFAENNRVMIRNDGSSPIESMTITMDGQPAAMATIPEISGLVGYWSFNDETNPTADNSEYGNNGTLYNGPVWVDGKYGKALEFDGNDDEVVFSDEPKLDGNNFTIMSWLKPQQQPTWYRFAYYKWRPNLYLYLTSGWSFELHDTSWPGGNFVPVSINEPIDGTKWYFTAQRVIQESSPGAYNGQHAAFLFLPDGTVKTAERNDVGTTAGSDSFNFQVSRMGWMASNNARYAGIADEVRIYNRALSDEEIKQSYSGLVAPGRLATVKVLTTMTLGTHTIRLCTPSMCQAGYMTII